MNSRCRAGRIDCNFSYLIYQVSHDTYQITLIAYNKELKETTSSSTAADKWIERIVRQLKTDQGEENWQDHL